MSRRMLKRGLHPNLDKNLRVSLLVKLLLPQSELMTLDDVMKIFNRQKQTALDVIGLSG